MRNMSTRHWIATYLVAALVIPPAAALMAGQDALKPVRVVLAALIQAAEIGTAYGEGLRK